MTWSLVRALSRSALTTTYQSPTLAMFEAARTVDDPDVDFDTAEPLVSVSNPFGMTIRTDALSPNAQPTNVANAGPTRISLFDRGAPPGRSNVTCTRAVCL